MTTPTKNTKEIKMNTPTPFSRERKKLDNFLLEVEMYQMMNNRIYDTDQKKIIFTLFIKDGVAEMWKQHTAENATFRTWEEFKDTLKRSFTPADTTVKQLCMNLHFFCGLVSAMNIILGYYNLIILLELMV